jgi:Flp pilus assembly protein TadG
LHPAAGDQTGTATMSPKLSLMPAVQAVLRSFPRNTSASVGMTFALAIIPTVGMIGVGVDYSRAANVRSRLQAAADAAAVGAVATTSAGYQAALSMVSDGAVPTGVTQALNIFNGDMSLKASDFTLTSVTASVQRATQQLTSVVTFTATLPTDFMGMFGNKIMTVTGSATAANKMPTYIDFYLLLDNTPSMGLGATPGDINTLVNGTTKYSSTGGRGCAFACHDISANGSKVGSSTWDNFYADAKSLGVTKRIDVVAQATAQLMDTATATETVSNQFRMAVYTFGSWGSMGPSDVAKMVTNNYAPNPVTSLTSNLATAKTQAAAIDLMTVNANNENGDEETNYDLLLPAMSNLIPNPGTGTSSAPQKWLFLVTDGMTDEASGGSRKMGAINTSLCTAIKQRGINIAVLYTTYWPLPSSGVGSDPWTTSNVLPLVSPTDTLAPAMQACASPGFYWAVSPSDGIAQAMSALFQKAVQTARLTN